MILDRGLIVLDPSEVEASADMRRHKPLVFLVDVVMRLVTLLVDLPREDP